MRVLHLSLALSGFAIGMSIRGFDASDLAMIIGAAFGMLLAEFTRWVWP